MAQPDRIVPGVDSAAPSLWGKFFGYLTADGLNYLLGFAVYGWLIRLLTDRQYGNLSVATSIYQVLMMVAGLGLDLIGPRLITDAGGNASHIARRGQRMRLAVAWLVCGPLTVVVSYLYLRQGQVDIALVVVAGFSMVVARALDVTYLAVALGAPGALARTRALGLGLFLASLFTCQPIIFRHVWIVPVLNAVGLTIGRYRLMAILRRRAAERAAAPGLVTPTFYILKQGAKAGSGQLLLFILQGMDVVLLARFASADAVGQYAMVSRLYLFGTAILACLLNTYTPVLIAVARDAESLAKVFHRFLLTSTSIGVLGGLVFWMAAPFTCELLGHRQLPIVHRISPVFAILFLVMSICTPFLGLLPSLHRSGTFLAGICLGLLILLGVDLTLIPRFGLRGAAIGQLAATSFLTLFMAVAYWRSLRRLSLLASSPTLLAT